MFTHENLSSFHCPQFTGTNMVKTENLLGGGGGGGGEKTTGFLVMGCVIHHNYVIYDIVRCFPIMLGGSDDTMGYNSRHPVK